MIFITEETTAKTSHHALSPVSLSTIVIVILMLNFNCLWPQLLISENCVQRVINVLGEHTNKTTQGPRATFLYASADEE